MDGIILSSLTPSLSRRFARRRLGMAAEKLKEDMEEDDTLHGIIKVDDRFKTGGWASSVAKQRLRESRLKRGGADFSIKKGGADLG